MKVKDYVATFILGVLSIIFCNQLPTFRKFAEASPFEAFVIVALTTIVGILAVIVVKLFKKGQAQGH